MLNFRQKAAHLLLFLDVVFIVLFTFKYSNVNLNLTNNVNRLIVGSQSESTSTYSFTQIIPHSLLPFSFVLFIYITFTHTCSRTLRNASSHIKRKKCHTMWRCSSQRCNPSVRLRILGHFRTLSAFADLTLLPASALGNKNMRVGRYKDHGIPNDLIHQN